MDRNINSTFNITGWDPPSRPPPPLEIPSLRVWCAYPVSGAYTLFQRLLFWVIIVIILVFQFHEWLTAGALAFAVGWSVTPSIDALILSTQKSSAYDADLFVLQIIFSSSIYATFLCILFSPRILGRSAIVFYCFWSLLILICRLVMQFTAMSNIGKLDALSLSVYCNQSGICDNPCNVPHKGTLFRDEEEILQPVIWYMPVVTGQNISAANEWLFSAPRVSWDGYDYLCWFWTLTWTMLGPALQCVLINTWKPPRIARNYLFRRLQKTYLPRDPTSTQLKKCCLYVLVWIRYFWLFISFFSLEIFIVTWAVHFGIWA